MYTSVKSNIARPIYKYVHFCIKLCVISTHMYSSLSFMAMEKFVCSEGHPLSWSIRTSRLTTVQHYIRTVQQNIIIVQRNIITYVFLSFVLRLTLFCCNLIPCWKNQDIRHIVLVLNTVQESCTKSNTNTMCELNTFWNVTLFVVLEHHSLLCVPSPTLFLCELLTFLVYSACIIL